MERLIVTVMGQIDSNQNMDELVFDLDAAEADPNYLDRFLARVQGEILDRLRQMGRVS